MLFERLKFLVRQRDGNQITFVELMAGVNTLGQDMLTFVNRDSPGVTQKPGSPVVIVGWPIIARLATGLDVELSNCTLIPDDLLHNTAAKLHTEAVARQFNDRPEVKPADRSCNNCGNNLTGDGDFLVCKAMYECQQESQWRPI